ncbi:MAG: nicotinamide-nucleotide amidohydrolase family protein, partial [Verrucomicrobiota bacterium]|nr:nicotinamide-nucleotide amidohydrolase family protein [Verrucomicrobiota bacterium]
AVVPILRDLLPTAGERLCCTFRLACIGESVVEKEAGERLLAIPDLELGYCARAGAVDVRLIGPSTALEKGAAILTAAFPLQIYTKDDEEFEEVIVRLLRERGATLATAESCTGGHLANRLTNVSGSSAVFRGGVVAYANEVKGDILGVPKALLAAHGAVSAEVARSMAEGALRLTGAAHALATTGIAGPDGGSEEKPVGTVYIAWASASGETEVRRRRFLAERPVFKQLVSQTAFQLLRQRLLGLKD